MGHWHFWTTPEEEGERQPLRLEGTSLTIVLDGRLDNREEILKGLDISQNEGYRLSDAMLALKAYEKWGQACFSRLIGEFALVIHDEEESKLVCARDALGERTLFHATDGTRVVIASEAWAVAGAFHSPPSLNESVAAHTFSLHVNEDGQTLFDAIQELMPAHGMLIRAGEVRTWRYWKPDTESRLRGRSDEEYAQEFRRLLEESVHCRMRANKPVGVLMSGGLDSTSVACLAARRLAPQPLSTISYVFNELKDCDERQYINAVKEKWGLRSIQIPCDDAWPFKDWEDWPVDPNQPEGNPYRLIKERGYKRAGQEGLRVLLTGESGDHLYARGDEWLFDLIAERQYRQAWNEMIIQFRYAGIQQLLKAGFFRIGARRLIHSIFPQLTFLHRRTIPAWLSRHARRLLRLSNYGSTQSDLNVPAALRMTAARSSTNEIFHASRHGIELRHPYRDRRLIEYALRLPAQQLYFRGHYKHILRNAMGGILPDPVRRRIQPTPVTPLYLRGFTRERAFLQGLFEDPQPSWQRYIRRNWLSKHWDNPTRDKDDGAEVLVPWTCVSFDRWLKSSFV